MSLAADTLLLCRSRLAAPFISIHSAVVPRAGERILDGNNEWEVREVFYRTEDHDVAGTKLYYYAVVDPVLMVTVFKPEPLEQIAAEMIVAAERIRRGELVFERGGLTMPQWGAGGFELHGHVVLKPKE